MKPLRPRFFPAELAFGLLIIFSTSLAARAGSATWNTNPASQSWNTAGNWTPATVPNGPADIATFGASQTTQVNETAAITLNGITFSSAASGYAISVTGALTMSGDGVITNSPAAAHITAEVTNQRTFGSVSFHGSATSGESMQYTAAGGLVKNSTGGVISFYDQSHAGSGLFFTYGGEVTGASGQGIYFYDHSTAAGIFGICNGGLMGGGGSTIAFSQDSSLSNSNIIVQGARTSTGVGVFTYGTTVPVLNTVVGVTGSIPTGSFGGSAIFSSPSAAGCSFSAGGGGASGAGGGVIQFTDTFDTGDSVLIANGGGTGAIGGTLLLLDSAVVGGRVEVFSTGTLDLSQHNAPGASVGSIEGDGMVSLGGLNLTMGSSSLSTTFSGTVQGNTGSSLTKVGTGALTFNGTTTFPGVTTIAAGTIGGTGTIGGALTVGTGSGAGAFLAPAVGGVAPLTFTTQSALTFQTDGTYTCTLSTKRQQADQVAALGVTINSGAQFKLLPLAKARLHTGISFTVIKNTAATAISGTFANLAEGTILTSGNNHFKVSYTGGDGNDLTLTVQ